jgi:5-methylcytosine-specific restriction enzyme A
VSKRKDGSWRYDGHWRKVRQHVLERDERKCQLRLPGCRGRATEVDHIVDVAVGGALYDPDNCRAVCACHRRRSNTKRQRSRQSPPSQSGRR